MAKTQVSEMPVTKVDVLISFGGAMGGFEFAWDLLRGIVEERKMTAYLDAISLEHDENIVYRWDKTLGVYKMSNPNWDTFYSDAMDNCKYMIFIITKPWLHSYYCLHEFKMFLERVNNPKHLITPIFVIFKEAMDEILQNKGIIVPRPKGEMTITDSKLVLDYDKFYTYMTNKKYIEVQSKDAPGNVVFESKGEIYKTEFNYALDDGIIKQILSYLKK